MKNAGARNPESKPRVIFQPDSARGRSKASPSPEEIRQRAFELFIERGGIHGHDLDDWMQAERELNQK